ncbi:MAG: hypothetical protein QOF91_2820 [Alphaproteobacteria bacterium]|jgi:hypothetical protein|nr:hypothetical protein [Alphaproteobacteria bacterium]
MHAIDPMHPTSSITVALRAPYLYALGGTVPADRPLSFFPERKRGWLSVQCYVLRDIDSFLVLDTGLTIHRDAIAEGLHALVGDTSERVMVSTRREPDAIINLPWIVTDLRIQKVYAGGELTPLDFFDKVDFASARAHIEASAGVTPASLMPGAIISVGRLQLEVLRTSLRVLFTNWFYEATTRTLFSSDSWGLLTSPESGLPRAVTPADADISPDAIVEFLAVKFDWLMGINTAPIIADLEALVADRPIDRICPTYGSIIEGADACAQVFENTLEALRRVSCLPRRRATEGYNLRAMRLGR